MSTPVTIEGTTNPRCDKCVLAAGTAQQLSSTDEPCKGVWIQSDSGNSHTTYFGDATNQYMALAADNQVGYYIRIANLSLLWVLGTEGETINYFVER